jgi:hypothetical protein
VRVRRTERSRALLVVYFVCFVILFMVVHQRLDHGHSRGFLKFLKLTGIAQIGLSERIKRLVDHVDVLVGLGESARLLVKLVDQFLVKHFLLT